MKTEHLLARTLKQMMATQPLETISVIELSNKCNVSRKTFYYHYHDIYDLLTQVFLDEKIPNTNTAETFNELVTIVWKHYKNNEAFINATLASAGESLYSEFIYNIFYTNALRFINKYDTEKKLSANTKKSVARFYAYGYGNSLVYYLSNYKNRTLPGLLNCFNFLNDKNIELSVQKSIKLLEKTEEKL